MKTILLAFAGLMLTLVGCTSSDGAFTGSPHGYVGRIDTVWTDMQGTPSIIQDGEAPLHSNYGNDGSQADMPGTFNADVAGNITATGVPAYWLAKASFCRAAPQAPDCAAAAPPD